MKKPYYTPKKKKHQIKYKRSRTSYKICTMCQHLSFSLAVKISTRALARPFCIVYKYNYNKAPYAPHINLKPAYINP